MKRRYVFLAVVIILLLIVTVWLVGFLTNGKLSVSTDNQYATISLTKPGDQSFSKQATHSLTASLHSGSYIVTVKGNSVAASQLIKVAAHKTTSLTLNPVATSGTEPVAAINASSLEAVNNSLYYIDNASRLLYRLNDLGNSTAVSATVKFISTKWANSSVGVGQDQAGNLYAINIPSVRKLSLPVKSAEYFSISPTGEIYFANNQTVYKGTASDNFSPLYRSKDPFSALSAFNGGVTLISPTPTDSRSQTKVYARTVFDNGRTVSTKSSLSASAAWSPGAKYLASTGSLSYVVFDSGLKIVATIPNSAISYPVWANDDRLLYATGDQLWSYSVSSGRADLIANMPLGAKILGLSISDDKSYAYLDVSDSVNGPSVKRVGLNGQKSPEYLYQLQSIMPQSLGSCVLNLVNLTQPVVAIQDFSESPGAGNCQSAAAAFLSQRGFDVSKFRLQLTN